jgi:signal transduction histidine kinase
VPDILVVDDDPRSRKLLEGYLKHEGYGVRFAEDGNGALRLAEQRAPDVVLLDVMMPGMTGFEVCQALKNNPRTRLSQVMMVTALDATPDRVQGLDTGADDYLPKPVRREEFLAKVRALLRARGLLLELEDAQKALAARNRELELKKTLAQTIIHDLKNPLCAVLGNLDLLRMTEGPKREEVNERCKQAVVRMQAMIMNLLDVEAMEDGHYTPEMNPVPLREVVLQVVNEVQAHAGKRGVKVIAQARTNKAVVEGDAKVLRRVVDNLVANAIQHSPVEGTVTVSVTEPAEGVEINVSDQGKGVPEDHRERIFEKYASLSLREEGTKMNRGLGLTFCRLAVEAHGGSIWVEGAPWGGAVFRLLLPAAEPGEEGTARDDDRATMTATA